MALWQWSKALFGRAKQQLHIAQEVILRLDMAQEERLLSDDECKLRKDLKVRILGLTIVQQRDDISDMA